MVLGSNMVTALITAAIVVIVVAIVRLIDKD
jgi:hypothetical protein